MTTPVTLTVAEALVYAQTSSNPIIIQDSNDNIAASADALVALGVQIVSLQGNDDIFYQALSAVDLLVLSTKTYSANGSLELFTTVTDTAVNVAASTAALGTYAAGLVHAKTGLNLTINDSSANIASNATALQALAAGLAKVIYGAGHNIQNDNYLELTINDTAANIAANANALQTLAAGLAQYTYDSGHSNNNTLDLTVNDTAANIAAQTTALQTLAAGLAKDTYASNLANYTNNNSLTLSVNDTAANVAAKSSALQTLAAGLAQDTYDSGYSNNNGLTLTINDTAANIAAKSTALQTLAAELTQDTYDSGDSNNNRLTLTINDSAANVAAKSTALQTLAAGLAQDTYASVSGNNNYNNNNSLAITVNDTAANVAAKTTALQTLAAGLAQATYTTDFDNKSNNSLAITVNDTAANIAANAIALQTLAAGLAQDTYESGYSNNNSLTLTVNDTATNILTNATALQTLAARLAKDTYPSGYGNNNNHLTLTVNDTAANIVANAIALQTLAAGLDKDTYSSDFGNSSNNNNSLILTINDTAANILTNATALQTLAAGLAQDTYASVDPYGNIITLNNNTLTLTVTDTLSAVLTSFDNLNTLSIAITAIKLTDNGFPAATLTVSQYTADAALLAKISTPYSLSITDSAVNVATALDTLLSNAAKLSGIALTDGGTPALGLTASQLVKDASVLGKINTPYTLNISGELAAKVATDINNSHVTSIAVGDTAAHISTNLTTLAANAGKISTITLTDPTTPTLSISASQFVPDAPVLGKISSPYKLALTDKGIPAIALTASQYSQYSAQLANISTPYSLKISGETVANLSADLNNSHVSSVGITDSAANVLAVLDTLVPDAAKLSGIALTDGGTPALAITATQFVKDASVISKISAPYSLSISGELAAKVATDVKNSHVTSIAVVDSAAHVSASLATLASNASKLSGITLTDKTTPTLSLTTAQVTADLGVLNAISSPYLLSVKDTVAHINGLDLSGVHDSQIEIMPTSLLATLTENSQITDLNLAQIKLTGVSITEKAYQGSGTEVDIVNSKGAVINQLFFTHDTEAQLHLLGIGTTVVHVM